MDTYEIQANREIIWEDYASAELRNKEAFERGDVKASSEYIYSNQVSDANNITELFYKNPINIISVIKRTKVGMDGLMIEILKNMTTHHDDNFVLNKNNVFILTGMSNILWENDMKQKMPDCFRENVYHHGKLHRLRPILHGIKNALLIIDEIDSGDKVGQKLHMLLKESGIWDIQYMKNNNIRFIFVSATMVREIRHLYKWGDIHHIYKMTVPDNYIGHDDFLDMGIIQEFYPIKDDDSAKKWIQEDILDRYGSDFRVHIIRSDERNKSFIIKACRHFGISYKNHTCDDRVSHDNLVSIFENVNNHIVLIVKGFYRRANLIPNDWKLKIGATHERFVKRFDTSVQIQGLPGRMTGCWKSHIINGHITGPHRTSIHAMLQYQDFYQQPLGKFKYRTSRSKLLFTSTKFVNNMDLIKKL